MQLSSVPGISGDEGCWGMQALAWLAGRPYITHTTSGNPIDLLFLIPLRCCTPCAPPSFQLLRTVPALVNLLALPIGFWFVRRAFGETTAWIYTVTMACLPTAIAHSRICQDPSQTVFWTGIAIYLALLGFAEPDARGGGWRVALAFSRWLCGRTQPTSSSRRFCCSLPQCSCVGSLPTPEARGDSLLAASLVVVDADLAEPGSSSISLEHRTYLNRPWLSMAARG